VALLAQASQHDDTGSSSEVDSHLGFGRAGSSEKTHKHLTEEKLDHKDVIRPNEREDDRYDSSRHTKSVTSISATSVDPFQYQVQPGAFLNPDIESAPGHRRNDCVLNVMTIERESKFTSNLSDYRSCEKEPVKEPDPTKEEADRAYYEIVAARNISSNVIRSRSPSPNRPFKGWGAIAAGIIGAGARATTASSSETPKASKSKDSEDKKDAPHEYRGAVVELESPLQGPHQPSRLSLGLKPTSSQSSHAPGTFDDDVYFTAILAAGLQDTGFDPNIVINDPEFRRRDSLPGSNGSVPYYQTPFAHKTSELGNFGSEASGVRSAQDFVIAEVATTPQDWRSVTTPVDPRGTGVEEPEYYFEMAKLSKKEQRKREKAAKRRNSQTDEFKSIVDAPISSDIVDELESYMETPKKSKKSMKRSSYFADGVEESSHVSGTVSIPVDAFNNLTNSERNGPRLRSLRRSPSTTAIFIHPQIDQHLPLTLLSKKNRVKIPSTSPNRGARITMLIQQRFLSNQAHLLRPVVMMTTTN
jgi:hypothetical protein